jgi:hypothetical protein
MKMECSAKIAEECYNYIRQKHCLKEEKTIGTVLRNTLTYEKYSDIYQLHGDAEKPESSPA